MIRFERTFAALSLLVLVFMAPQGSLLAETEAETAGKKKSQGPVIDLGQPGSSLAVAISNAGHVVGFSNSKNGNKQWGWISTGGGKPKKIKGFKSKFYMALGVNNLGTPVGQANLGGAILDLRAFRGNSLLPAAPHQANNPHQEFAVDINDSGTAAGFSADLTNNVLFAVPVIWHASGPPTVLPGTVDGGNAPMHINNAGDVAGRLGATGAAVLWRGGGPPVFLPLKSALDINDQGTIAGVSKGGKAAILRGGQVTEIGPGIPVAINNHGQVLGINGLTAFWIWDAAFGQRDISCLFPAAVGQINRVTGFNDSLQVVGVATLGGKFGRAFLWNLGTVPGTSACPAPVIPGTILGVVEFDKVPVDSLGLRTDLIPVVTAAAGVTVEAVDEATSAVLASTKTDSDGKYELNVMTSAPLHVRALADNDVAKVVGMSGSVAYAVAGPSFTLASGGFRTENLSAPDAGQASGPFNMADALRRAAAFIRKAEPSIVIPKVTVRWAVGNTNGTFFRSSTNEAFIRGDRATDSDEQDDGVILHEYGHFLTSNFSRDDSPGGTHATKDLLDPRLAWNEGWSDFFGVAAQDLTPVNSMYFDSMSPNPGGVFSFDDETNVPLGDTPGYWSEATTAGTVWDLFDGVDDTADSVQEPWPQIWLAYRDLTSARFTYLIDWADVMVAVDPSISTDLQSMLGDRQISFTPGAQPSVPDPFPAPIDSGVKVSDSVDSLTRSRTNLLDSSDFYEFTLAAQGDVTIDLQITGGTPGTNDLDLFLKDDLGMEIAHSNMGGSAAESIMMTLAAGTYVIEVRSFSSSSGGTVFNSASYDLTATY